MRTALVVLSLSLAGASAQAPEKGTVEIKTVKYTDLGKAIRAQRGKVIVVDFWASWCQPCKKEFPHLVELHKKHASEGLVCVSVSVDTPGKEKAALTFLKAAKAEFANYRLEEGFEWATMKMEFGGIPVVYVFDRDNKRVAKFTGDDPDKPFSYEKDVTPLVLKLLRSKPGR